MSSDEEGNDFHELDEVENSIMAWNQQKQQLGLFKLTDEARRMGYTEDDLVDSKQAIILWPALS